MWQKPRSDTNVSFLFFSSSVENGFKMRKQRKPFFVTYWSTFISRPLKSSGRWQGHHLIEFLQYTVTHKDPNPN